MGDAETVLEEFGRLFKAGTPFAEDRAVGEQLLIEAAPAVSALLFAHASDPDFDLSRAEHGEGLALVTLLGRRAASLGVSPTAATSIVPALVSGFRKLDRPIRARDETVLSGLCLEGYVAGKEERIEQRSRELVAESQGCVEVVPRVILLVLAGEPDAESLAEVIQSFGRVLLKRNAVSAIVEMTRLTGVAPDRAAEVFTADQTARMLGVGCWFVGVSEDWRAAAQDARVDLDLVSSVATVEEALVEALPPAGKVLRPTSWLWGTRR